MLSPINDAAKIIVCSRQLACCWGAFLVVERERVWRWSSDEVYIRVLQSSQHQTIDGTKDDGATDVS